jgi:hypothetical protein
MEPDLQGFRDASVRLRAAMGREVVFLLPEETVWPDGTILDPETQEPYDPTIVPAASGWASASATALVVLPGGSVRGDTVVNTFVGTIEEGDAAVIVSSFDFETGNLEAATRVVVFDETWDITQADPDSVGGNADPDRVILHARQRGGGSGDSA